MIAHLSQPLALIRRRMCGARMLRAGAADALG